MQLGLGRPVSPSIEAARQGRRSGPAIAVSLALNGLLIIAVWSALSMPRTLERFFGFEASKPRPVERVEFVEVRPSAPAAGPASPGRPLPRSEPPAPPLIAPREVPTTLPPVPAPSAVAPAPSGPTGPLAGGNGPTKGVAPTYTDPRIWLPAPPLVYAPKTDEERLDSAVAATIRHRQDSIAAETYSPNKYERGDWTVERNGRKYGIDQQYIHLGKVSIPTALLALLPFNRQANPGDVERARAMAFQRADIMYHAQAAITEQEFRDAVKAIRERKDREHKAQLLAPLPSRKGDPHATVSPGDRPPQ